LQERVSPEDLVQSGSLKNKEELLKEEAPFKE
jgi:hypothetical protein